MILADSSDRMILAVHGVANIKRMERVHKNEMCHHVKWFEQNKCGAAACDRKFNECIPTMVGSLISNLVLLHFQNIFFPFVDEGIRTSRKKSCESDYSVI